MSKQWIIVAVLGCLAGVHGLDPYQNFEEGACSTIKWPLGPGVWNRTQMEWVDTLTYKPAASRYDFYRTASAHPSYQSLTEHELINQLCRTLERTVVNGVGECFTYGFGKLLGEYDLRVTSSPSRYGLWEFTPRPPLDSKDIIWQRVTATDGKTWAFYAGCHTRSNQKQWVVASNTPNLSLQARRAIIDHAVELGFKREQILFLNYDSCDLHRPSGPKHDRLRLTIPKKPMLRKLPLKQDPQPPQIEQRRTSFVKVQSPSPSLKWYPPSPVHPDPLPHSSHEDVKDAFGWASESH